MNTNTLQNQIDELKDEIKELENINEDRMIDVEAEIKEAKKRLNTLQRMKARRFNSMGKSRDCTKSKKSYSI